MPSSILRTVKSTFSLKNKKKTVRFSDDTNLPPVFISERTENKQIQNILGEHIWYWANDLKEERPMFFSTPDIFNPANYSLPELLELIEFSGLPTSVIFSTLFF